jgi:ABC-type phosphate/phosphonate transport system substrate-binding protein
MLLLIFSFFLQPEAGGCEEMSIKYAVSQKMIGDIDENDALASIKVWTESLAERLGIKDTPAPHLYRDLAHLEDAVTNGKDNFYYITIEEYFHLLSYFDTQKCIVPVKAESPYEQYILVVHKKSGISSLQGLAHSSIVILDNSRMIVGPVWLDNRLHEENLGSIEKHFQSIEIVSKVNKAILPVFFQKKKACFVTKDAFSIMAELNPQLSKQLVILAESPAYIPSGLFFRKGFDSSFKQRLYNEITEWTNIASYRQLSIIFQLDGLRPAESTILDDTVRLLQKHVEYFGTSAALQSQKE